MMIASGYSLQVECDCIKCRDAPYESLRKREIFFSDAPGCKKKCFDKARRTGWTITRAGICYAPGHERDLQHEKRMRADEELEID